MFRKRSAVKQPNASQNRIRRRLEEDENDGDDDDQREPTVIRSKASGQKKSSGKRTIVGATASQQREQLPQQEDHLNGDEQKPDEGGSQSRKRKKLRMKGSVRMETSSTKETGLDDVLLAAQSPQTSSHFTTSSGLANAGYSREELERLRAEQQRYRHKPAVPTADRASTSVLEKSVTDTLPVQRPDTPFSEHHKADEESFIALENRFSKHEEGDSYHSTILAGDEAFQNSMGSEEQASDDYFLERQRSKLNKLHFIDDSSQHPSGSTSLWEAQVAHRAGIRLKTAETPSCTPAFYADSSLRSPALSSDTRTRLQSRRSTFSLDNLRQRIHTAIQQLQLQQLDLIRTKQRRQEQITLMQQVELLRYQQEQQVSGQAHEYFQHIRHRFVLWVGALRELLQTRLNLLQETMIQIHVEMASVDAWEQKEDDVCSILQQFGHLDRAVGRQPDAKSMAAGLSSVTSAVVDEFGRSVPSQYLLSREKRFQHWQLAQKRKQQQRERLRDLNTNAYDDEGNFLLSESEYEDIHARHLALKNALAIACEEVDEEFTKLRVLVDDFTGWYQAYPDAYKQCYASLSLADLASVLVRVDLCAMLDDPWANDDSASFCSIQEKWMTILRGARTSGVLDQTGMERLIEKSVLPFVVSLVNKMGINLSSKHHMKAMGDFMLRLGRLLSATETASSAVVDKLRKQLVLYTKICLDGIALPIARKEAVERPKTQEESELEMDMYQDAMHYATLVQRQRVQTILTNLLVYWTPFLQADLVFAKVVLEFIGTKFLFLMSSLRGFTVVEEHPLVTMPSLVDSFHQIWEALKPTKWLERPENIVLAAPIQAAAAAYGLKV